MNDKEAVEMLQPKADAYDNMAAIIGLLPRASRGMGEDLSWVLDRRIAEISATATAAEA